MKIKNNTDKNIEVLGVTINALETRLLLEIGNIEQLRKGSTEIISGVVAGDIEIQYLDGTVLKDLSKILSLLTSGNSDITISNFSDFDIGSVSLKSSDIRGDDFYYNSFSNELHKGEVIEIQFKGYLKTMSIKVNDGSVLVQFVKPRMNIIKIGSFNTYDIDSDFKIKDPIIRIESLMNTDFSIYLDGLYFDKLKTKEQYLEEIYASKILPLPSFQEDKKMIFDLNFLNKDKLQPFIVDEIMRAPGILKGFTSQLWKSNTSVNMKSILNVNESNSFSKVIWFKPNKIDNKMYLDYKSRTYYTYIDNRNNIIVSLDGKKVTVGNSNINVWHQLIITYDKYTSRTNIYLNGSFATFIGSKLSFQKYNRDLIIGNKTTSSSNYGFNGELGRYSMMNYTLSAGMVSHLYSKDHPNKNNKTNLKLGINNRYFDLSGRGRNAPDSHIEFDLMEKEYCKVSNLLFQDYTENINFLNSTWDDITTRDYYMTINTGILETTEDQYFKFKIQGDDSVELMIDDRVVCSNYGLNDINVSSVEGSIYLEAGNHEVKFRHYNATGNSVYSCMIYNTAISDYEFFNLQQNDTEDEVSTQADTTKLLNFSEGAINTTYIVDPTIETITKEDDFTYFRFNKSDSLKLIKENVCLDVFTLSMFIYLNDDRDIYITTIGAVSDWQHWFELKLYNKNRICIKFCDKSKNFDTRINKKRWYKLDVVSDGTKINLYINGEKDKKSLDVKVNEWFKGDEFYINRLSSGSTWKWMEGDFSLNDYTYYNIAKTKEEIETSFMLQKDKYNL